MKYVSCPRNSRRRTTAAAFHTGGHPGGWGRRLRRLTLPARCKCEPRHGVRRGDLPGVGKPEVERLNVPGPNTALPENSRAASVITDRHYAEYQQHSQRQLPISRYRSFRSSFVLVARIQEQSGRSTSRRQTPCRSASSLRRVGTHIKNR
jgi:hypothetical protein